MAFHSSSFAAIIKTILEVDFAQPFTHRANRNVFIQRTHCEFFTKFRSHLCWIQLYPNSTKIKAISVIACVNGYVIVNTFIRMKHTRMV